MSFDLGPREARALANTIAGMERGGYGIRHKRLLELIGTSVPEFAHLVASRGSDLLGGLVAFVIDRELDTVTSLLAHSASAAAERFRAAATSDRHREGVSFAFAVLLFLLFRQGQTGAPGIPFADLIRQFEQVSAGLETRLRQHLDWLDSLGLVQTVPGAEPLVAVTAAGKAVFPLPLLERLVAASQGAPVPADAVARFFGLPAPDGEIGPAFLSLRDRVVLARVIAAAQTGDGLPVEHALALLGLRDPGAVPSLLERANAACRGIIRFVLDASGRAIVAFADLDERDTRSPGREQDLAAAVLMYLFYAQATSGAADLAEEQLFESLAGLGTPRQLLVHTARLEKTKGLVRRLETADGRRIRLTAAGWAAFPPWLYDRLPAGETHGLPPLQDAEAFFRRYAAPPEAEHAAPAQQLTLFEEDEPCTPA